jgi:hypothetical protein
MDVGHQKEEEFDERGPDHDSGSDHDHEQDHDYEYKGTGGVTWLDILGRFADYAGAKVKSFS